MSNPWNPYQEGAPLVACAECGGPLDRTERRCNSKGTFDAFGGRGRERKFCGDVCRQRASRRVRAARLAAEFETREAAVTRIAEGFIRARKAAEAELAIARDKAAAEGRKHGRKLREFENARALATTRASSKRTSRRSR
jgi:hypothetical protein